MSELYPRKALECCYADTCLSDYWSGHHEAHVSVPVYKGMSMKALKNALHSELNQGAVAGSNPLTCDNSGEAGDRWYKQAHAAINRMTPARKGARRLFTDLEESSDDDNYESVQAFFVFMPIEL